jgi:hypothetical protein
VRQLCFVCVVSAGLGCCSLDGLEAEAARLAMAVCLSRRETGGHSQLNSQARSGSNGRRPVKGAWTRLWAGSEACGIWLVTISIIERRLQ